MKVRLLDLDLKADPKSAEAIDRLRRLVRSVPPDAPGLRGREG